ncbi:MAG: chloride channel protein [Ruminococcaceae bacterium]|nr:chloride channel protein [Oscillospiraceae bacterium]
MSLDLIKNSFICIVKYIIAFLKWVLIAIVVGIAGGLLGSVFHICIDRVTELRVEKSFLIYFLPVGGIVIAALYRLFSSKGTIDTNRVIKSVRRDKNVPLVMIPLIFISTVITHMLGGSAGREGAALQLGGSIGYNTGKALRLKKNDMHIIVMSGMSAVFAALFGTPLTATIFSLEVTNVGVLHYAGLLPCIISSVTASQVAKWFNLHPVHFSGIEFGNITWHLTLQVIFVAVICAVASILFCLAIKKSELLMDKLLKNSFIRAFAGGIVIVLLTMLVGTRDYNGAGMDVISRAIGGEALPWAFVLKIIFTAITIAAGFKGGEIVPAFFIGSTLGCVIAPIVGLSPALGAAVGFVALFCGVVNCPIASIILSLEVFGAEGILFFAIATAVSYMLSGYFGLYESQKISYSKIDDEYIDVHTK